MGSATSLTAQVLKSTSGGLLGAGLSRVDAPRTADVFDVDRWAGSLYLGTEDGKVGLHFGVGLPQGRGIPGARALYAGGGWNQRATISSPG
ncbi:hypothetical protein GN956_G6423 [Arapaima gigas]